LKTSKASIAMEDDSGRPVAYLEYGGATALFRSHGVKRKRLVPINDSWDACTSLYAHTGVRAIHYRIGSSRGRNLLTVAVQTGSLPSTPPQGR
jgi:hypothetical protein